MADLELIVKARSLIGLVEQVNPKAVFQPAGLDRNRPPPYPLLPSDSVPLPPVPTPTAGAPAGTSTTPFGWAVGEPFDLEDALKRGVACQRRTGRHKQFTFVFRDDPTWIYKGPYSTEKVTRYARRVAVLKLWALPNVVLPDERVFPTSSSWFIRFPNMAKEYPIETEEGLHTESFSKRSYCVLQRTVLVKAKDVIGNKAYPWALSFIPTLTYQLSALALLDVGDMHLSNVLVDLDKKEFYIIDVEETRTQPAEGPWAFMTHEPAASIRAVWADEVSKGRSGIIDALRELPIEPDLEEQRTALIASLEKYYPDTAAAPAPTPALSSSGQMQFLGGMAGLMRSLTYSGVRLDVAKSGMQKYMRRGRVDDALMMAFEIFRFRDIPVPAVITNLRNRLSVAVAEDVGPADVPTVLEVLRVCNTPPHVLTEEELYALVVRISNSAKTRVCSWVARTYGLKHAEARAAGIDVDASDTPAPTTDWPWRPTDPEPVVRLGNLVYDRLKKKDLNVFKWAPVAEKAWDGLKLPTAWPGTRRTKPVSVLWRMMEAQGLPKTVCEPLETAYMTVAESTPFLRLALWLCVKGVLPPGTPMDVRPTLTLPQLLAGQYRVVVDPFIVDKHTMPGRALGLGREEFANEGAVVVNEDPRFDTPLTQTYHELYRD